MARVMPKTFILPTPSTVEAVTKRTVTLRTALNEANFTRCHPQTQSILYQIPAELRDIIFELTLAQYEDKARSYPETASYYRPGHTARLTTSTNLLLACRWIWLEANALPMQQAVHTFWFPHGPHDLLPNNSDWMRNTLEEYRRYAYFVDALTSLNLRNLTTIHLFMALFQLDNFKEQEPFGETFPSAKMRAGFRLKVLWVTIRHYDWWDPKTDAPLWPANVDDWLQYVLDTVPEMGVEEFRLELETIERKKDVLQRTINRLITFEGITVFHQQPSADGSIGTRMAAVKGPPEVWRWTGTVCLGDEDQELHQRRQEPLHYYVATLRWHHVSSDNAAARPRGLSYALTTPLEAFFRRHDRLARYRDVRWGCKSYVEKAQYLLSMSVAQADRMGSSRREQFERIMGDFHAARIEKEWAENGSLLLFEPLS